MRVTLLRRVLLELACVALPTWAGIAVQTARAQEHVSAASPSGDTTMGELVPGEPRETFGRAFRRGRRPAPNIPQPADVGRGVLDFQEPQPPNSGIPKPPSFGPETFSAPIAPTVLDVIRESIFGAASEENWQPLSLSTFFTEGWNEPYAKSPPGTNGAPKQNWFGAADGVFSRLNALEFFYTNGLTPSNGLLLSPFPWAPVKPKTTGNEYWASDNLYIPLNQRLELLVVVPFVASNTTSPTGNYVANVGDLTISERFRLIEQRNFTMQALLTERTPTGQTVNGNDINYVTPSLEYWWNFAPKWVMRAGTGINIDTGRTSATSNYFNNAAIGRYLTSTDARIFRHLVAHVAVSTMSDVLGRKNYISEVYVAPGLRFGVGQASTWSILGAIQIPVSGPHPYAFQPNLGIARNY
jgi:hypothetical protein